MTDCSILHFFFNFKENVGEKVFKGPLRNKIFQVCQKRLKFKTYQVFVGQPSSKTGIEQIKAKSSWCLKQKKSVLWLPQALWLPQVLPYTCDKGFT